MTAQRRNEVAGLPWSELDLPSKVWHLPKERAKNKKAHDIHLSDLALEIIAGLVQFKPEPGKPDFVFSVDGDSVVIGFAYAKARIDKFTGLSDWQLRDLRRTAATKMAEDPEEQGGLGIAPHVVDRILNHVSGTIRGVAAVYNKGQFLAQRRAALEAWGRFVEALVRPETAQRNVIGLRR